MLLFFLNRTEILTEEFCLPCPAINSFIISRWKELPYKWSFFLFSSIS